MKQQVCQRQVYIHKSVTLHSMPISPDMLVSPFAPDKFASLPFVGGLELSVAAAGIKTISNPQVDSSTHGQSTYEQATHGEQSAHWQSECHDLLLVSCDAASTTAGVFTRSLCAAAPIEWSRDVVASGTCRAVVVNSGNANALTGASGYAATRSTAEAVAAALDVLAEDVLICSTGVIGEDLPVEKIELAVASLKANLRVPDTSAWEEAAKAICTTDTFPKGAFAQVDGTECHILGIAKGSGMIAPDMATMLAFLFTDLVVEAETAQVCLAQSVEASFNCITIDSDASTNDAVLLVATGASGVHVDTSESRLDAFQAALNQVTLDLAHQVVKDGEGVSKFVAVTVTGAHDGASAEMIARAVADSPLVKTALAASDANWGRIAAAVGNAKQRINCDRLAVWIGDEQCVVNGSRAESYCESAASQHLKGAEIELRVDVGVGDGKATVWTCDLTEQYVKINAGYRT